MCLFPSRFRLCCILRTCENTVEPGLAQKRDTVGCGGAFGIGLPGIARDATPATEGYRTCVKRASAAQSFGIT